MVAAGCKFRSRFTGYESEALSPDFIMEAAGGRFECRERRVGTCGFGCCDRVAASFEARGLRGGGVVGVSCVAGGLVGARAKGDSRGI
jgi:hypothetical protein